MRITWAKQRARTWKPFASVNATNTNGQVSVVATQAVTNAIAGAEAEACEEAEAVELERRQVESMQQGAAKEAAKRKLAEDEAHAALKAEEARKIEEYEEKREHKAEQKAEENSPGTTV